MATTKNDFPMILAKITSAGAPTIVEIINRIFFSAHVQESPQPDMYAEYLDKRIEDYKQSAVETKTKSEERRKVAMVSNEYLQSAITSIKKAQESTTCSVCLPKIEDAGKYVEKKTKEIIKSGLIYEEMEKLQLAGEIPKKPWRELTQDQKSLVKSKVN